jgi:hypothetical protein
MPRATAALLWQIWRGHRSWILAIVAMSVAGRLVHLAEGDAGGDGPSPLAFILGLLSFLFVFGVFTYTESSGGKDLGGFPRRLFTLPVPSLQLVAVPAIAGIVSVELVYLSWMEPLSRGGTTSSLFIAVLLAAFMAFYHTVMWTLERLGPMRLLLLGVIGTALLGIGFLPSFPASDLSFWQSEATLAALVAGLAVASFLLSWRHVARLRSGGRQEPRRTWSFVGRAANAFLSTKAAFASQESAHFWFEWRCSGTLLPLFVGGVLLLVIAPLSWLAAGDPAETARLVLSTLAMPIILAIPVGMAFSKPIPWTDDLSVPAFVAVRPLSSEEIVAIKARVAALAAGISWLLVLVYLAAWLSLAGYADLFNAVATERWPAPNSSAYSVYGTVALLVMAGFLLTWRFMVTGLWIGLSGSQRFFSYSVISFVVVALVLVVLFDRGEVVDWALRRPERVLQVAWIGAFVVAARYWFGVYVWRRLARQIVRQYFFVWLVGTACFAALAAILWRTMAGLNRGETAHFIVLLLLALLVMPLGRLGLAPDTLARNRHRR